MLLAEHDHLRRDHIQNHHHEGQVTASAVVAADSAASHLLSQEAEDMRAAEAAATLVALRVDILQAVTLAVRVATLQAAILLAVEDTPEGSGEVLLQGAAFLHTHSLETDDVAARGWASTSTSLDS